MSTERSFAGRSCGRDPSQHLCGRRRRSVDLRWRGANVKLILRFQGQLPDAHVIALEQNYRSTQTISMPRTASSARNRIDRTNGCGRPKAGGAPIVCTAFANAQEEAHWVVEKIEMLQRAEHIALATSQFCAASTLQRPALRGSLHARPHPRGWSAPTLLRPQGDQGSVAYSRCFTTITTASALHRIINVPARGIGGVTVDSQRCAEATHRHTP